MTVTDFDARPMAHRELSPRSAISVFGGVDSYLDLQYAAPLGFRPLYVDLHVPQSPRSTPTPCAVYAHGGGFLGGIKAMGPWRFLLDAGYAVASIDYRLTGEARFPDPVHDFAAAVRYLRAHAQRYGLDADRLFGFGSSAGAYLAAAAALGCRAANGAAVGPHPEVSDRLAAIVDHYGPTDFLTLDADAHPDTVEYAGTAGSSADRFLGFIPSTQPDRAAMADLTRYVTAAAPPFLLAHGDIDRRVGLGQSQRLYRALTARGVTAELLVVTGADHGDPRFDESAVHDATLDFLHTVLC